MTWVSPFKALPRAADDLICGVESGPEAVYADDREAEEAADRRHDFSDHLEPSYSERPAGDPRFWSAAEAAAAWSWHMGPDR